MFEQNQSINTEQFHIEENQLCIVNITNIENRKNVQSQNKSVNKVDFNSKYSRKSDKRELDCRLKESRAEK